MSGNRTKADSSRRSSRAVGKHYDELPYFRPGDEADPALDIGRILGLSRLYGGSGAVRRVLDLGCGSGALLDRAARYAPKAELVGVDISPVACAEARRRLAAHGRRADIREADLLELDISTLGPFDVIFAVGIAFCVPELVTERVYAILQSALRPGGVAVIGHYAGARAALTHVLFETIQGSLPADLSPGEAVLGGRGIAWAMGESMTGRPSGGVMAELIQQALQREDEPFYHEVLNPHWRPLRTGAVAERLEPGGISFACSLSQARPERTAAERVMGTDLADLTDLTGGGHRYSLFAHIAGGAVSADPWREGLAWSAPLVRDENITNRYINPHTGVWCDAGSGEIRALLDATRETPRPLAGITALRNLSGDVRRVVRNDILILAGAGLALPIIED